MLRFDQFGPLSIRPTHGSSWAPRKKPARLRATYRRTQGIRYFHGCYALAGDQLWGITRERRGGDHTLAALKSIRDQVPYQRLPPLCDPRQPLSEQDDGDDPASKPPDPVTCLRPGGLFFHTRLG